MGPQALGRLTLRLPGGTGLEQEFELGKPSVTLGRATTNDIALPDARVSRLHARIDCKPAGCTIQDLKSANGTWVNGVRVEKSALKPGDVIQVGDSILQFEASETSVEPQMTIIDSERDLDLTLSQMTLALSLNDTSQPRLVVHTPDKTWEIPLSVAIYISIQLPNFTHLLVCPRSDGEAGESARG